MRSITLLAVLVLASPMLAAEPLFNGKDTTGWTFTLRPPKDKPDAKPDPKDTWSVKDGVLICTGKPNGYIATAKEYADYKLSLQYRYPAGTEKPNSGVLIHVTGEDRVWPNCVEVQTKFGFAGDFWLNADKTGTLPTLEHSKKDDSDKTNRHYLRLQSPEKLEKPLGEWNTMEVECGGDAVKVWVNGQEVNAAKKLSLTKGRIALQSEGSEVHFREIAITPLPK